MSDQFYKDIAAFSTIFVGSSLSGWAFLIWKGQSISKQQKFAGAVLSGVAGVIVGGMLWGSGIGLPKLMAISVLCGIGGASTLEWLMAMVAKKLGAVSNRKFLDPSPRTQEGNED